LAEEGVKAANVTGTNMSEFGTATWSGCDFKSRELCRFREPRVVAERAAAIKTSLDSGKLFVGLRQLHMIHPARRSAYGPGGKQTRLLRRSLMPSVQAAPLPLCGARDAIRPQGISFQELEKRILLKFEKVQGKTGSTCRLVRQKAKFHFRPRSARTSLKETSN
jgi:hypothetical protein